MKNFFDFISCLKVHENAIIILNGKMLERNKNERKTRTEQFFFSNFNYV